MEENRIDLSNLPKKMRQGKEVISWKEIDNCKVNFVYKGEVGFFTIIKYNEKTKKILTQYKDNDPVEVMTKSIYLGTIDKILGHMPEGTKYSIGDKTNGGVVIDIRGKGDSCEYKVYCQNCKQTLWRKRNTVDSGNGCPVCSGLKIIEGLNDFPTKNPNLMKYICNKKEVIGKGCNYETKCKCPICSFEKKMKLINLISQGFSCPFCDGGASYPEKFIYTLLKKLKVSFIWQYTKKNASWCNNYKYDFYFVLNNEEYIIEVNGGQHYKSNTWHSLEETQKNDQNKYNLAIQNGIRPDNYIVIDFRFSNLEWGKEHIINSRLKDIFDLSKIEWELLNKEYLSKLINEVANYYNQGKTKKEISKLIGKSNEMVNYYLRKCKDLNLIEIQKTTKEKVLEEISEMELPISTKNMDKISKKLNIKYTNLKRVLKDLNIPFCRKPINQPEKSMKKVIYLPTLEIYNSLKEASEKTGVGISTISSHINGKKEKIDFMRYEDYLKLNTLND